MTITKDRAPQIVLIAFVLSALIVAAGARVFLVERHFTQVDDIGVAATILEARREIRTEADLRAIINNKTLRQHDGRKFQLLRMLDEKGVLGPAFGALGAVRDVMAVPARWTYAPAQYLITPLLISETASYRANLVGGRAPSVVFSLLAMGLVWAACARRGAGLVVAAFAFAVMALSLELLVYSVHMSNYAAGVAAAAALVWLCSRAPDSERPIRWGAFLGLKFWGLALFSYQILPLLPAAFAAILLPPAWSFLERRDFAGLLRAPVFRGLIVAGLTFLVFLVPVYLVLISGIRPITWNAGPANEFVVEWANWSLSDPLYPIRFIADRGWMIFSAMTTPVEWASEIRPALSAAMLFLFLIGTFSLIRRPHNMLRFGAGVFILVGIATTLATALLGLTALSPTRHALILLPLFAIAIGEGAASLASKRGPTMERWAPCGMLAGLVAFGAVGVLSAAPKRIGPLSEEGMVALAKDLNASAIIQYDHTYNVDIMRGLEGVPIFNDKNLNFPWRSGAQPASVGQALLISTVGALSTESLKELMAYVDEKSAAKGWSACKAPKLIASSNHTNRALEVYPLSTGGANSLFIYSLGFCL